MATKAVKLPSGNYRSRAQWDKGDGKQHYKSFTAETAKEAHFLAVQYELTQKESRKPENLTVGIAIDRYIEARSSVLSPSTIRGYRQCRRLYLQTVINTPLEALTSEMIQRAVNEDAKHHSPKTVRNAHGLLVSVLADYHPDLRIKTRLPQKERKELNIPRSQDQIKQLLADVSGTHMEAVILLAACGGLRRSEICALDREDINPDTGLVSITKALVQSGGDKDGRKCEWVGKGTKTYSGTRKLYISISVAQRIAQISPEAGRIVPVTPGSISDAFHRLCKANCYNFTLHGLRHHAASVMLALGVPDKYAMKRMGHATPDMLKAVYQHTMDKAEAEMTERINAYYDDIIPAHKSGNMPRNMTRTKKNHENKAALDKI